VKTIHSKRHKRLVELIVALRKQAGIRQTQLAKKLKRSQTWIARLESGERRIDVIELIEIAEACNGLIKQLDANTIKALVEQSELPNADALKFDAPAIVAAIQQSKK